MEPQQIRGYDPDTGLAIIGYDPDTGRAILAPPKAAKAPRIDQSPAALREGLPPPSPGTKQGYLNLLPITAAMVAAPFTGGMSVVSQAGLVGGSAALGSGLKSLLDDTDETLGQAVTTAMGHGAANALGQGIASGLAHLAPRAINTARNFVLRAFKPSAKVLRSVGAANDVEAGQVLADRLMENKIWPSRRGYQRASDLAEQADQEIADIIGGSTATVRPSSAVGKLKSTRRFFAKQATPESDLAVINRNLEEFRRNPLVSEPKTAMVDTPVNTGVLDEFGAPIVRTEPTKTVVGVRFKDTPVQTVHEMKRGTMARLRRGTAYGELSSAEKESQKALASGLRQDVARAEPKVAPANEKLSKLLPQVQAAEDAAERIAKTNPVTLGDRAVLFHPVAGVASALTHPGSQYAIARLLKGFASHAPLATDTAQAVRALVLAALLSDNER